MYQHLFLGISLWLFWAYPYAQAQDNRIDQWYERIKEKIQKQEYYVNEVKLNSHRLALHFKEQPSQSEKYYYAFQNKNQPILHFITTEINIGNFYYYSEYVFDSKTGKLLLYLERQNDQNRYPYRKLKVYFQEAKPTAILQSQDEDEQLLTGFSPASNAYNEEIKKVLSSAKYYKDKFQFQMEEVLKKIP